MQGWIKLHRQITESEFWRSEKFNRALAWVDLLLLCNHKAATIFIKGVEIHLLTGQLAWSQQSLAARWRWDVKKVRRFLSELEKREMVSTRTDNKTTIVETSIAKSLVSLFMDELAALGGQAYIVQERDLPAGLKELLESKNIDRVLADERAAAFVTTIPVIREPDPAVRAGVTGALAGIAETGSLLLVSGAGQTLTASLLPEVHVAILRASQLVPTLADALRLPEVRTASAGVIVTGPSRTADIEMTLTIGVHGPGELHVFLIDDSMAV